MSLFKNRRKSKSILKITMQNEKCNVSGNRLSAEPVPEKIYLMGEME